MSEIKAYERALEKFRGVVAQAETRNDLNEIISNRDIVFARYRPVFSLENIEQLREESFRSFLYLENNHHWSGLYRMALRLCSDMGALRKVLAVLLDPSQTIVERYDHSVGSLNGFGKALATAILLISSPDQFGVWNNTSEAALKTVNIWPEFARRTTAGQRYEQVNLILNRLACDLKVDLWTLDALMWGILPKDADAEAEMLPEDAAIENINERTQSFGLERHLHDFLLDNWDKTTLGKEWAIYSEPGDDTAGYEYPTDIGRIDLLAHHRQRNEWLVIELKRDKSSDETVGQVLRYIGWVKNHLVENGESVGGLIIAREAEDSLRYALSALEGFNIGIQNYEVEFHLKPVQMNFQSKR